MSKAAPVSLGIVNMNVTIGGVAPMRRRNRQAFSYVFNQSSVYMFNFKDKEKTEAIGETGTGEFGITLKGANLFRFHNWLGFLNQENLQQPSSASSIAYLNDSSGQRSEWVNPGKTTYSDVIEGNISMYSADGSFELNNINAAKVQHFLFVPDGSLFMSGLNTEAEAFDRARAETVGDESGLRERMYSFYRKFVPYHKEILLAGAHINSGASNALCASDSGAVAHISSLVDANLEPNSPVSQSTSAAEQPCKKDTFKENGEDKCVQTAGRRHITFDNIFTDIVVEQDPRLWKNIRENYTYANGGNKFGEPISQKVNLIKRYVHPGIHATYKKYTPLFRGMDFEISFRSMSKEAAVAKTNAQDRNNVDMLWALREEYDIIDAARSPKFSSISIIQPTNLPANNAVCSIELDKNKRPIISSSGRGYYFADQPYVVIDINAGKENRYFLLIPEKGNILFCEGTMDVEIIDYFNPQKDVAGTDLGSQKMVQENLYHSRVLYDFGFSGHDLLSSDGFVVRFQHLGGKLGISFGNQGKLHIISRYRWVNDSGKLLIGDEITRTFSAFISPKSTNYDIWMQSNPNVSQVQSPIMLEGNLSVSFGNKRFAFIFNPVEYPEKANISPELPAGVLGLEGYTPAINILLRSRGGPERPNTTQVASFAGGIIENEDGPINVTSNLTNLASRNISHIYDQTINGGSSVFYYTDLPADFRSVIPLDPYYSKSNSAWIGGGGTKWFALNQESAIAASYAKIPNPKDLANHVTPILEMRAGSVVMYPLNFTSSEGGNDDAVNTPFILQNCIRPILKEFELLIAEGGSKSPMFQSEAMDVIGQVTRYSEQMTESNKETIKHTAQLDLFLNFDSASRVLELINKIKVNNLPNTSNSQQGGGRPRSTELLGGTSVGNSIATDEFLASLQDKYFYLRVRAHRSPDTLNSMADYPGWFWGTKDNKPPDGINDVLFTGLCVKTAFTIEAKGVRMSCTLADYGEILENSFWIQPVFYDAMRDYNAVLDIATQAGFYAGERDPIYDPAALVKRLAEAESKDEYYTIEYDGEEILVNDYVLPGSYDMINSPKFKASKFEPYNNVLSKIGKVSGKVIYFDRLGVLHFDIPEDELENMQRINASPGRKNMYEAPIYDKFSITIKNKGNIPRPDSSSPASVGTTPPTSVTVDTLNVPEVNDVNWWNVVSGMSYTFTRMTDSVKNEIRIYSSSPNMSIKKASHLNIASMYDPTIPGFIGYRKMFVQRSGFFGSEEAVKKMASRYSTMMNPPVEATFQVPGRVGLRPLHTVILDGVGPGSFKLLLREVSNEIDPKTNSWFCNIRGRYLMPAEKIEFKPNRTYELGVP